MIYRHETHVILLAYRDVLALANRAAIVARCVATTGRFLVNFQLWHVGEINAYSASFGPFGPSVGISAKPRGKVALTGWGVASTAWVRGCGLELSSIGGRRKMSSSTSRRRRRGKMIITIDMSTHRSGASRKNDDGALAAWPKSRCEWRRRVCNGGSGALGVMHHEDGSGTRWWEDGTWYMVGKVDGT